MNKYLFSGLIGLSMVGTANAAPATVSQSTTINTNSFALFSAPFAKNKPGATYNVGFNFGQSSRPFGTAYLIAAFQGAINGMHMDVYKDNGDKTFDTGFDTLLASIALASTPIDLMPIPFSADDAFFVRFTNLSSNAALGSLMVANLQFVPVPAAAWLFGSALLGAGALRRKAKQA